MISPKKRWSRVSLKSALPRLNGIEIGNSYLAEQEGFLRPWIAQAQ